MHHRLSLSGEIPPASVLAQFDGIGLIRSEYVVRAEGHFINTAQAQQALSSYVAKVTEITAPEANTLVGVDQHYDEVDFMKGRRGVRRAREQPAAFETELRLIADIARSHPNLHVIAPFVRDAEDFGFVADTLDHIGWPNRFGSMIEIPSAMFDVPQMLAMGASNFLLGLNDLSSLLTATTREFADMKLHPSVWRAVQEVRERVGDRCEWGIAGNLSTSVLERAEQAGVPYASEHYSDLVALRGIDPSALPDLDFVARTKAFTRAQIDRAQEAALLERLGQGAGSHVAVVPRQR